jgi:hypothetical protein
VGDDLSNLTGSQLAEEAVIARALNIRVGA